MPMIKGDLERAFFLDVCANGSVNIRERGKRMEDGFLPVFTTDTREQAEDLRIRYCRRANDGSGLYHLNDRPRGVEDLGRVSDLFRAAYEAMRYPGKPRPGADPVLPAMPGEEDDPSVVKVNDLREGLGTHHPRVRVLAIDEDGDARCVLVRSGSRKTLRVVTLSKAYKLVERDSTKGAA